MPKPRKLTAEELEFLEETLEDQEELEFVEDNEASPIKKKDKPAFNKRKKVPPYKNPMHWVVAFILAPVLLSGAFMFFLLRLETVFGAGSLQWLSESESGGLVKETASDMGMTWLPEVIQVYDNRWLIIGALFTLFFVLAIMVIVYDNVIQPYIQEKRNSKKKKSKSKKVESV